MDEFPESAGSPSSERQSLIKAESLDDEKTSAITLMRARNAYLTWKWVLLMIIEWWFWWWSAQTRHPD